MFTSGIISGINILSYMYTWSGTIENKKENLEHMLFVITSIILKILTKLIYEDCIFKNAIQRVLVSWKNNPLSFENTEASVFVVVVVLFLAVNFSDRWILVRQLTLSYQHCLTTNIVRNRFQTGEYW